MTQEINQQDEVIEKTTKQKDTLNKMCNDIKTKINSKSGKVIITEEFK